MSAKQARFQFSVRSFLIAVLLLAFAFAIAGRNLSQGPESPAAFVIFAIAWLVAFVGYIGAYFAFHDNALVARESGIIAAFALSACLVNLYINHLLSVQPVRPLIYPIF